MGKIWVSGQGFDCGVPIVRWDQGPGYDASKEYCINPSHPCPSGGTVPYELKSQNGRTKRYGLRPALRRYGMHPPLEAAQAVIKQFVFHHDGCPSAKTCFNVLHNERGFSAHFLIDNDGTIYQTLDLSLMAYHAAKFNANSIGVEICNRGNAKKDPRYYSKKGKKRDIVTCRIHDHTYLCFDFTPAQEEALKDLARGLSHALPNLPLEYPQETPGRQSWSVLPNVRQFSGYLGHYHTTRRKWDPGPFDFKKFCESIRGSLCFPLYTGKGPAKSAPAVPQNYEKLSAATKALYSASETRIDAGFFPVGRYGKSRLWHGGVHIPTKLRSDVYAAFPGRAVVARFGANSPAGSQNFVLLRHDMSLGETSVRFYSLYYHLDNLFAPKAKRPKWLENAAVQSKVKPGRIALIDVPVEGGEIIGQTGQAGPGFKPELHFEIFSQKEILGKLGGSHWSVIDGTAGGRFCTHTELLKAIDRKPKDGKFSREELISFFRGSTGDVTATRRYITLHVSEWTGKPDWYEALKHSDEFKDMDPEELRDLVDAQVTPSIWWTDAVARHAKLPRDGVVYHYHPISFIRLITEKVIEANALAANGVNAFSAASAAGPPAGVTDDIGDVAGDSFVDASELVPVDLGHHLTLEDLVAGYPEE